MNELYCKKCMEFIGKSGDPSKLPAKCPKCGMRFFPARINKMVLYGLLAGGGQIANGQHGKYAIFSFGALMTLLLGTMFISLLAGIVMSGLIVLCAMGDAIKTAEDMAGFAHTQVAVVD